METNKGFTQINNDIVNWEWYTEINTKVLFLHLLIKVNFEKKDWRGITIERGQTVTSIENLANETGLTVSKVKTAISHLLKTNYIKTDATNKYTLLTLLNYDVLTFKELKGNKQNSKQIANKTQSKQKEIATTKETKETKETKDINMRESEIENEKLSLSNFDFLLLNYKDEVLKLETKFKTKLSDWNLCIEKFNEHPHVKNITTTLLKSWLIKELAYEVKNPELVQALKEKTKEKVLIGGGFF